MKRADSRKTRERLLEVAGKIFAEVGFDRATGKNICHEAKVNVAAIHYHFGSVEGLYEAVLEEAHKRLVTHDIISAALEGKATPADKLTAMIELVVKWITSSSAHSWEVRVWGREWVAPNRAFSHMRDRFNNAPILRSVVADLLNLPKDHPKVAQCCFNIVAPGTILMICDRGIFEDAYPSLSFSPENAQALTEHFVTYALAGIAAVRKSVGS